MPDESYYPTIRRLGHIFVGRFTPIILGVRIVDDESSTNRCQRFVGHNAGRIVANQSSTNRRQRIVGAGRIVDAGTSRKTSN